MRFFQWIVLGIGVIIIILLLVITAIVKRGFEDVIVQLTPSRNCLIDIRDTLRAIAGKESYFIELLDSYRKKNRGGTQDEQ